mmetsp:Transcript_43482/g.109011  ORF Transcript_43482/g.109011 Transcript_43482/m.109011 type:complete len:422 (-) Transcript_43482:69-1334(-)
MLRHRHRGGHVQRGRVRGRPLRRHHAGGGRRRGRGVAHRHRANGPPQDDAAGQRERRRGRQHPAGPARHLPAGRLARLLGGQRRQRAQDRARDGDQVSVLRPAQAQAVRRPDRADGGGAAHGGCDGRGGRADDDLPAGGCQDALGGVPCGHVLQHRALPVAHGGAGRAGRAAARTQRLCAGHHALRGRGPRSLQHPQGQLVGSASGQRGRPRGGHAAGVWRAVVHRGAAGGVPAAAGAHAAAVGRDAGDAALRRHVGLRAPRAAPRRGGRLLPRPRPQLYQVAARHCHQLRGVRDRQGKARDNLEAAEWLRGRASCGPRWLELHASANRSLILCIDVPATRWNTGRRWPAGMAHFLNNSPVSGLTPARRKKQLFGRHNPQLIVLVGRPQLPHACVVPPLACGAPTCNMPSRPYVGVRVAGL